MPSKTEKKRKKSSGVRIVLRVILGLLLYTVLVLGIIYMSREAYRFSYQVFGNDTMAKKPGTDVIITIRRGDTTREISEMLEYKNVIRNDLSFFVRAKLMVNDLNPILPGVYKLNTSMNYGEIIRTITDVNASLEENNKQ